MTPSGLTLLIGGARSGKSALAVELGRRHERAGGAVTYVATSPRIPGDDDLDERIAAHRAERPEWPTIEEPTDLGEVLRATGRELLMVDCLTLWVNNLHHRGDDGRSIVAAAEELAGWWAGRSAPTVVITNEVGLGIVPAHGDTRTFRDTLGRVNATVAARAARTLLLVAGRAVPLTDPWSLL